MKKDSHSTEKAPLLEFVSREEEILNFWKKNNIFQKSLNQRQDAQHFVFYEGPPTANGRPGIHHILARSFKDLVCRYKTMRGFLVERKAGWDTHGLPVEIEVEKQLGFKNKGDIKKYGVEKFNDKAKSSVWRYKKEWEEITERMGFWIDMDHPYITLSADYMESVWWLLKQAAQKNLIAKVRKVLPYCPRCGTPLSGHEVSLGYENVQDPSLFIKFQIINPQSEILRQQQAQNKRCRISLLVWTTTPWTLPANVAVAVRNDLDYKIWQVGDDILISHSTPPEKDGIPAKVVGKIRGEDLAGEHYQPLYQYPPDSSWKDKKVYEVVSAQFVSLEEGTGLVHIAPAFGEDDRVLGEEKDLVFIQNIGSNGCFLNNPAGMTNIKGLFFKEADPIIFADLEKRNLLYQGNLKGTVHDYPFCWRCKTPLIYYSQEAWVIKMSTLRSALLENNRKINWVPTHIKKGRFGQWLEDIRDWTISRKRYWGTPLPIWECPQCGHFEVIGSLQELKSKANNPLLVPPRNKKGEVDLHRPYIDNIKIKCPHCGAEMSRVEEVLDCWFDSGSMPYAQWHWPFAQSSDLNLSPQELIKSIPFPADFICEAVDQTRGWFYTLLAIATVLDIGPAYKNVICLGLILDEKGEKMSKSRGNIVLPMDIIKSFGVDSLRWYFYTMNAPGEEKRFSQKDLLSSQRRFLNILWNVLHFYSTYGYQGEESSHISLSVLDQWILAQLEETKEKMTNFLDHYSVQEAGRELESFADNLSRWYLRRSRKVFQKKEDEKQWKDSSFVLRKIMREVSLLLASFCPFFSEMIWQTVKKTNDVPSVHLADWPTLEKKYQNKDLLISMDKIKDFAAQALRLRQEKGMKVRQPLSVLKIKAPDEKLKNKRALVNLLKEEINVKKVIFSPQLKESAELDFTLTPALIKEGIEREFVHKIQMLRQKEGLIPSDKIKLCIQGDTQLLKILQKQTSDLREDLRAKEIKFLLPEEQSSSGQAIKIDGKQLIVKIDKI